MGGSAEVSGSTRGQRVSGVEECAGVVGNHMAPAPGEAGACTGRPVEATKAGEATEAVDAGEVASDIGWTSTASRRW